MISKNITAGQFKEAIRVGFENDEEIKKMYCPYVKVNNINDIIEDIYGRIIGQNSSATIKGVYEKNQLVGYYVYEGKTLISFCLNVNYRTKRYIKEFWSKIRKDLKGSFQAFLWTANIRGYKWLQKMGMKIIAQDNLITHLIF